MRSYTDKEKEKVDGYTNIDKEKIIRDAIDILNKRKNFGISIDEITFQNNGFKLKLNFGGIKPKVFTFYDKADKFDSNYLPTDAELSEANIPLNLGIDKKLMLYFAHQLYMSYAYTIKKIKDNGFNYYDALTGFGWDTFTGFKRVAEEELGIEGLTDEEAVNEVFNWYKNNSSYEALIRALDDEYREKYCDINGKSLDYLIQGFGEDFEFMLDIFALFCYPQEGEYKIDIMNRQSGRGLKGTIRIYGDGTYSDNTKRTW